MSLRAGAGRGGGGTESERFRDLGLDFDFDVQVLAGGESKELSLVVGERRTGDDSAVCRVTITGVRR
jgi:hypothetical protein